MTPAHSAAPKARAMEFNALALMASTVFTGVLGMLFWIIAARLLPPTAVGQASSALSAITFLAGLAQLNIISVLLRFVPRAGRATGGFIARAYGLSLLTGLLAAGVFLALGFGSDILGDEWFVPLVFIGATLCYALFLVQDGALTSLGGAVWVPLENLLAGLLRVGLLFALVPLSTRWGALAALVVPTLVAVGVVNTFVFRRLVPRHVTTSTASGEVGWRSIRGFVAGDYAASALASCVALLPPVLVSSRLGSEAAAYFYIPWFIGVSFGTLVWNIAMAFVVEYAGDAGTFRRLIRRSVRLTALVSVAACAVVALAAPLILTLLGTGYADEGATALRLIALSFPFSAGFVLFTALSVARKKLTPLVASLAVKTVVFLTVAVIGLPDFGIDGLALLYLVCEAVTALAVLPVALRFHRELIEPGDTPTGDRAGNPPGTGRVLEPGLEPGVEPPLDPGTVQPVGPFPAPSPSPSPGSTS
ncbi:lipopolysaccharide biosynthesis protein [Modestobacter altitudinis]|uniref:lipopolysaccharide biosynthesis protein n=1 Tax=Modestobacter altitudinis TaxID=2213158 RepID=UPI00110C9BD0|nr:lipopolysaccharide biosynthesis protein [Modestobacter altitudinis]